MIRAEEISKLKLKEGETKMKNVQFDVKQFNNMMGIDNGEIVKEVTKGRKGHYTMSKVLITWAVTCLVSLPISGFITSQILTGILLMLAPIVFYFFMGRPVLQDAKAGYLQGKSNSYWRSKLNSFKKDYDSELGIGTEEIIDSIQSLRQVYFHKETYEVYIPINNIYRDDTDTTKIKFKDVPKDFHTKDYFKDKLNREDMLELKNVEQSVQPSFDEVVVILQSESEIRMQQVGYTPTKQLNNVLGKNSHIGLQTVGVLKDKNKELLSISDNINNIELPNLYKENKDLISRIND